MFKKFSVKEDVSGSTSLKSSVQRTIRQQLLEQFPLLSAPAYRDEAEAPPPVPAVPEEVGEEEDDDFKEEETGKKKKGKGGGKGDKGGKKGKKAAKEDKKEDEEDDEGPRTLMDDIWPKKESLGLTKCHDRINIYTLNSVPLFMNHYDGPFIPTLKLLHKYPVLLPHVQVDRGAIKFLLAGANMMAPGLLSAGGALPDGLEKDAVVAIHAEGKAHAAGIGKMAESAAAVRKSGKGVAVEVLCWVGDDFWKIDSLGL
ncbi:translation machinery-associated protein 20 [Cryptotrichosporon argae]